MYNTLDEITKKIMSEINEKEEINITGVSLQSCSVYFEVNSMVVRISDHEATRSQLSHVDYFLALDIDNKIVDADDFLTVKKVYGRLISDENENGFITECNEHDDDAEHIGYRINEEEIGRVVDNIIYEAK